MVGQTRPAIEIMNQNGEIVNYVTCQPIQIVSNTVDKLTSKIKKMFNKNVKVKIIYINWNTLEIK